MTLGEFLFRQLRTHEVARDPNTNLWLTLPQRRRDEYESAAGAVWDMAVGDRTGDAPDGIEACAECGSFSRVPTDACDHVDR